MQKINLLFNMVLFKLMLDVSYVLFVSNLYDHEGYNLSINYVSYLLSWFIYFVFCFFAQARPKQLSDYYYVIAAMVIVAPILSLYALSSRDFFPVGVTLLSLMVVFFIAGCKHIKIIKLPDINKGLNFSMALSILMVGYLIVWYIISGSIGNINLSLASVYEYREETSRLADIGVLAYVNNWVYQVFTIFLIVVFLAKKRYSAAVVVFLIQFFFFSVAAYKALLFYPFLIAGAWLCFRNSNKVVRIPLALNFMVLLALSVHFLTEDLMFASIFIRRLFYVPAILTFDYFEFFSSNTPVYWSSSILSMFIDYPYDKPVPYVIGEFNGSGAGANNGYISSGYAHFGVAGVMIYSVILGLILKWLNIFSSKFVSIWLPLGITIIPMFTILLASDLLTTLLTHGLIVSIVLLYLAAGRYKVKA